LVRLRKRKIRRAIKRVSNMASNYSG